MAADKWSAFCCSLLATLDAALPFKNGPAGEIILSELGKDGLKIHLAVAQRTKTAGALQPRLIAAINALLARGTELRVLHVEHLDARVIEINKLKIVELLDYKMTGIVKQVAARMLADAVQKHFERRPIVKIFPWMNFITEIDSSFVKRVEDGEPSLCEFIEGRFDESSGALWPRVNVRPRQSAGKRDVGFHAEVGGSPRSEMQLLDGPSLPGF